MTVLDRFRLDDRVFMVSGTTVPVARGEIRLSAER